MSRLLTPEEIVFAPQKEADDGEQDEVEVSGLPD